MTPSSSEGLINILLFLAVLKNSSLQCPPCGPCRVTLVIYSYDLHTSTYREHLPCASRYEPEHRGNLDRVEVIVGMLVNRLSGDTRAT